ncbi:MAG: DUF4349 domain-containing protein [Anaerolineales bacterium]|nr:MAG: DUF4349 domain-containing protein [Anaerolineales bacterium]
MRSHFNVFTLPVLLGVLLLSACGGAAPAAFEEPAAAPEFLAGDSMPGSAAEAEDAAKQQSEPSAALPVGPVYNTGVDSTVASTTHMIIKSAEIKLLVESTDNAIDRATQVVGDAGGYIISSRIWYQTYYDGENYKYATITIGVPVQQFERTLSRLRGLAVKVLDESASGEDVTDQYVDLQSQLINLEATRERIKSFLDDAKTVDEALRINAELSEIERQIEEIKGRMNYLQDRSSYSTITINFEPVLPEILPTPTPQPEPWNPAETFESATKTVTRAYQGIVDFLIWLFIVLVPIFAPPVLIIWVIWKLLTRKPK